MEYVRSMALIVLMTMALMVFSPQVSGERSMWMEPSNPVEGDTVTFYFNDLNATDVSMEICYTEESTICYVIGPGDRGQLEDGTWWVRVNDIKPGMNEYKVTYKDTSAGNRTTTLIVDFNVESKEEDGGTWIPVMAIYGIISSLVLILVAYWAWRRHNSA